jgi:hypothetical protein
VRPFALQAHNLVYPINSVIRDTDSESQSRSCRFRSLCGFNWIHKVTHSKKAKGKRKKKNRCAHRRPASSPSPAPASASLDAGPPSSETSAALEVSLGSGPWSSRGAAAVPRDHRDLARGELAEAWHRTTAVAGPAVDLAPHLCSASYGRWCGTTRVGLARDAPSSSCESQNKKKEAQRRCWSAAAHQGTEGAS